MSSQRESVTVLQECIDLQILKSVDYQNPNSNIKQAMHYRRGVSSIHDMIAQKLLRAQSLIEPMENGESREPNFESLEDTYKDAINYLSFAVSYIRGKMEGQDANRDMFNRAKPIDFELTPIAVETKTRMLDVEYTPMAYDAGGSSSGQVVIDEVEEDGFVTVVPSLLSGSREDTQNIRLNPTKNTTTEEKIKAAYFRDVAPIGDVEVPRGVVNCTDPVQHSYVKTRKKKLRDVGDRIEEDYKEHIDRNYP